GSGLTGINADSFTVTSNNTTDETVYPVFVDGVMGSQGAETDSGLTYNPSTGNLTAIKFTGDGSGLTGITASGSGVVIKNSGSTVGTAGTINFGNNLSVSAISGGAVTITATGGSGSGISTISSVVNIADDLDVDGHTNLDNVSIAGVVTATSFVGALTGNSSSSSVATEFSVTSNNSADETVYPVFVDGVMGSQGAETDSGLTYNPSTGNLTATKFTGDGSSITNT
ncbi:MAG: hypothetical protein VXY93_16795, partial [Pseudomonadota bacterium]|nr:hypothetical protein [Pseudomonadota bacterium]